MILFGNPLNVSVRKVRCSAAYREITIDEVSVLKGADDPIFRAASPAGVIPALRDETLTLFGALPIIEYLDGKGTLDPIVPHDRAERIRALSIAHLADGPLAQSVSIVFQNSVFMPRFLGKPGNMRLVKRILQSALPNILSVTEAAIADLRHVDGKVGIAQLAVFAQCLCLPLSGHAIDANRYPAIASLMTDLLGDPRLRPMIARDAGLVGSSLDAVRSLLAIAPASKATLELVR